MLAVDGLTGWPARLILRDDFPLLPAEPPRRVVVYTKVADPDGIAPVISTDGSLVHWSGFRDIWEADDSVFVGPGAGSSPAAIPDLVFDAQQYTAEVRRATAAREWESDEWRTALLLHEHLHADRDPWDPDNPRTGGNPWSEGSKWHPGSVEPEDGNTGRFLVTCWDDNITDVIVVALTAGSGTSADRRRAWRASCSPPRQASGR